MLAGNDFVKLFLHSVALARMFQGMLLRALSHGGERSEPEWDSARRSGAAVGCLRSRRPRGFVSLPGQSEFKNTPSGLRQLCLELRKTSGVHVVCEATGGYEHALVKALHKEQIPVSVTNPAQVRAACQARGQRAKTDRIDAQMLTDFGQ